MTVVSFCNSENVDNAEQSTIDSLPFGENEKKRLFNIKNANVKNESLAALLALKNITDLISRDFDYAISRDSNGKPYFISAPFFFNLSHSCGLSVAVLSDKPVGVDIELIDESRKIFSLSDRYFSADENNFIRNSKDQYKDFYIIWTKKEAFSKIRGQGLSMLIASPKKELKIDYFKQYMIVKNSNQYILSLCFEECVDCEINILSHKELNIYGIQN